MADIYPVYLMEDVRAVRRILTKWGDVREAECFFMGCHLGLRAGDLLDLKFSDIEGKTKHSLIEKKTGKEREVFFTPIIFESIQTLRKYYKTKYPDREPTYLFQSMGRNIGNRIKPISRSYLYRKIDAAFESIGIEGNFGTHTMRKTFGYHLYKKSGDIAQIQGIFGHSSPSITLTYIGVNRKSKQDLITSLDFSA